MLEIVVQPSILYKIMTTNSVPSTPPIAHWMQEVKVQVGRTWVQLANLELSGLIRARDTLRASLHAFQRARDNEIQEASVQLTRTLKDLDHTEQNKTTYNKQMSAYNN